MIPRSRRRHGMAQDKNAALKKLFTSIATELTRNEGKIIEELHVQGKPVDIGGCYHPDFAKADAALRPSKTLNAALAKID